MYTKSRYSQLLASRPLAALAVRNAASRPIRLFLSLSLIAASGAILMSAFNTKESWLAMIDRVYSDRDYDLELKLAQLYPLARISDALSQSAAVSKFEGWQSSPANFHDTNGPPVLSTYPDGGHGSFNIYRIPSETSMVRFPVTEGRWLQAEDSSAIVLNQGARSRRPAIAIGDTARLQTDFGIVEGDVVGFIEEVGSSAAAYMPLEKFRREPSETPTANLLRIKLQHGAERDRESAISEIDAHLAASGILVRSGLPLVELNNAMSAHIGILIATLLSAALAIAIVASLGLSSILSMGVIERRKEFSILRAIGATPRDIMKLVLVESALIGLGGAALALPATLGISWLLGSIVGSAAFQIPLPLTLSLTGIACSSGGTAVIVGLAAVIPARLAARERARQALAAL